MLNKLEKDEIRVLITDEHNLFREGVRMILSRHSQIKVVGEAIPGNDTIKKIGSLKPDIVLLDIDNSQTDLLDVINDIKQKSSSTKILFLTSKIPGDGIYKALRSGANGYILKDSNATELVKAIQSVQEGELWLERKMITKMIKGHRGKNPDDGLETSPEEQLTNREREVLSLLVQGLTNKEIAQKLFISEKTVKSHLSSVFRKLRVTRRLQAILYAIKRGLT